MRGTRLSLPEPARRRLTALIAPNEPGWLPAGDAGDPPAAWAPRRRRPALLLVAVASLVAALVAGRAWAERPRPVPAAAARPATAEVSLAGAVVVDVEGAVAHAGVQRLPHGARVADALQAAGVRRGVALGALNLARLLVDGEQLVVGAGAAGAGPGRESGSAPVRGPSTRAPAGAPLPVPPAGARIADGPAGTGEPAPDSAGAPGAGIDLNSATAEQLQELDGVGPVLAERIVAWRTEHGRFRSVEDLREVSGIGPRKYARISPHVRV